MEEWYYALNGQQQGPVQRAVLMQLLSGGNVPPDSLVWREGMTDWVAANAVVELSAADRAAQPRAVRPTLNYGLADSVYRPSFSQVQYAGFGIRLGAWFVDLLVLIVARVIFRQLFNLLGGDGDPVIRLLSDLSGIAVPWLYDSLMQCSASQATLGMQAVGIQVTDLNGQRLTFGRATGRHFASLLSWMTVGVGFLMIIWSPRKQGLHDLIAGTVVIM